MMSVRQDRLSGTLTLGTHARLLARIHSFKAAQLHALPSGIGVPCPFDGTPTGGEFRVLAWEHLEGHASS